jgi:hypothetical protein
MDHFLVAGEISRFRQGSHPVETAGGWLMWLMWRGDG